MVNSSDSLGNNFQRQPFPLKLSWSITIDKSQGLTLKKAWIDLGHSEKVAGLTYVAVSRVRKLSDLIFEPMTFDRFHSLQQSLSYKFRLLEEQRLSQLAQITTSTHTKKTINNSTNVILIYS